MRQAREGGREREGGLKKGNGMNMAFSTRSNGCINLYLKDMYYCQLYLNFRDNGENSAEQRRAWKRKLQDCETGYL